MEVGEGRVAVRASMVHGRAWHAACALGGEIYVVGGVESTGHMYRTRRCERYHIRRDEWDELPIETNFDWFQVSVTVVPV